MIPLMAQPQTLHLPIDAMEQETWWQKQFNSLFYHAHTKNMQLGVSLKYLDDLFAKMFCWCVLPWDSSAWNDEFFFFGGILGNICFCLTSSKPWKELREWDFSYYFTTVLFWSCLYPPGIDTDGEGMPHTMASWSLLGNPLRSHWQKSCVFWHWYFQTEIWASHPLRHIFQKTTVTPILRLALKLPPQVQQFPWKWWLEDDPTFQFVP